MAFEGLPQDYFDFFRELKDNNDRAWFEANKRRYEESVRAPLSSFVEEMAPRLKSISRQFIADPKTSVFRIQRDVRFSKDKDPYKEHGAVQFRHKAGKDAHAPAFYVHLEPGEIFFGGGVWSPEPAALLKIRTLIRDKGEEWLRAKTAAAFDETFYQARGESLTRPPRGFSDDSPHIDDIKRKSFFAMKRGTQKQTLTSGFADDVETAFRDASPLMAFVCKALGAPF